MVEQWPVRPLVLSLILSLTAACSAEHVVPETRHTCDATLYIEACEELGLPHDYGVAWGCKTMYVPFGHEPAVLKSCVDPGGNFKCCVGK
jgi:hypothetical protein